MEKQVLVHNSAAQGSVALRLKRKTPNQHTITGFWKEDAVLDIAAVFATIVSFVLLIAFTRGCERL